MIFLNPSAKKSINYFLSIKRHHPINKMPPKGVIPRVAFRMVGNRKTTIRK